MKDIVGLGLKELERTFKDLGQPAFRARQVFSWIYKKGALDFDGMSVLPAFLRQQLKEKFRVTGLGVETVQRSKDGTQKLLIRLGDGAFIEAVAIPTEKRMTACISSQAGCKYACVFCASGKLGYRRDLSAGEMAGELLLVKDCGKDKDVSHVVFMGTGEPLDNYDNVMDAVRLINSPDAFGIGARRITISTCGIVPGIKKLAEEGLQIELSISLHAADDKTRDKIMPVNKRYPLGELIPVCQEYAEKTKRQVTFEYILIEGLNAGADDAKKLTALMRGFISKVNLIPFNPVLDKALGQQWKAPDRKKVAAFRDDLENAGVQVTVRTPRGQDIDAACGQLRLRYEKKSGIDGDLRL